MRLIKNLIPGLCSPATGYWLPATGCLPLVLAALLLAGPVFAGSEHALGRSAGNCGGVWKLPDTGQTICYDGSGGVIACPAAGASQREKGRLMTK